MRTTLLLSLSLLAGCGAVVSPEPEEGDAGAAIATDAPAPIACENSSVCPTDLACLQGFCQTPCEAYGVGCEADR